MLARYRRWREVRRREAVNRAAIRTGRGLVSMDVPPPVPASAPDGTPADYDD